MGMEAESNTSQPPNASARGLTLKQRKFVEAYEGNGTQAARIAGYGGGDNGCAVMAAQLLRNPKIRKAIEERNDETLEPLIATREERQRMWTEVMLDPEAKMGDRLRASELLGRSEGDFLQRVEMQENVGLADRLRAADERLERMRRQANVAQAHSVPGSNGRP